MATQANRNTLKETFLLFGDANQLGDDDAFVAKASEFLCMEIAGATTVTLKFRGGKDRDSIDKVTLTLPTLAAGAGTFKFKEAAKIVSGILNGSKYSLYTIADQKNSEYISPFEGSVTCLMA
tara:strand:+ start:221 stop:586 length:366 start_codon:yes stop_codon:yes gene_type:complete